MQTCQDCAVIKKVVEDNPRFEIIDIGEHVRNLKQFLALRDNSPEFEVIRQKGSIGVPCFVFEDGRIAFSIAEVSIVSPKPEQEQGQSCSIDGTGC